MKSFKDFQVNEEQLDEVDIKNFDTLVRSGLADRNQLQRLHTILRKISDKENPNLSVKEKQMLNNLSNKMLNVMTTNKPIFQKARNSFKEETDIEESRHDELKSLPPILVLKRRAIRLFPNGLKVATYYSDKLNKTFTLPMSDLNFGGVNEELKVLNEGNIQILKDIVKNNKKMPLKFADGSSMSVDSFTASAVTQVYDSINDQNKNKIDRLINKDRHSFIKVADFAFGLAKK